MNMKLTTYKKIDNLMKSLIITPIFKSFKMSVFLFSLNQSTYPFLGYLENKKVRTKNY